MEWARTDFPLQVGRISVDQKNFPEMSEKIVRGQVHCRVWLGGLCNLHNADLVKTASPWQLLAADGGGRSGRYMIVLVEDVVEQFAR